MSMRSFRFICLVQMIFMFATVVAQAAATEGSVVGSPSAQTVAGASLAKTKSYPGGRDEEELKVLSELRTPPVTVDRRGIEYRVLKTQFKKTDAEIVAPDKSDEEMHPPSENE